MKRLLVAAVVSFAAVTTIGAPWPGPRLEVFVEPYGAEQVLTVANAIFRGRTDLVLLRIAAERVEPEIRYENLEGGAELFPHVYGSLNRDAVIAVEPLEAGPDGEFVAPPSLARRV